MKSWSEWFEGLPESADEATIARLDEEFLARLEAHAPPEVASRDPGPDPLGYDWKWAEPPGDAVEPASPEDASPPPTSGVIKDPVGTPWHAFLTAARLVALAASLLLGVALGWAIFRGGDRPFEVLTATAIPFSAPDRGAGTAPWIEVRSEMPGFVTAVAMGSARGQSVIPGLGSEEPPIRPSSPARVPLPEDTTEVVYVVTETPAGEPIRRAMSKAGYHSGQAEDVMAAIKSTLEAKGYRRIAMGSVALPMQPLAQSVGPYPLEVNTHDSHPA